MDARMLDSFEEASGKQLDQQHDSRSLVAAIAGSLPDSVTSAGSAGDGQSGGNLFGESGTPTGVSVPGGNTTSSAGGTGSTIGSIATTFLESGMGIVPLVSGLLGLFGGGSSEPPALEKYTMPSAISFESADTASGLSASDFDQMGTPRLYSSTADSADTASGGVASTYGGGGQGNASSGGGASSSMPQISVAVQTMDAQSFLDNSDQIAQAVRGAMLNLSSINDVVNDL
jgi:hypothetical protein